MKRRHCIICYLTALSLAGCTPAEPNSPVKPNVPAISPVSAQTSISPSTVQPKLSAAVAPTSDVWSRLRSRFAIADCDAQPEIRAWAHRYTKNPRRFEMQMNGMLPQLDYVEQIAANHNVAAEFALLPWVESQYQSTIGHRNRPSGMWQIVPTTAHSMGLRMDGHYDGRLDVPASADAVMGMLQRYHDDFGDWRLVDYAYNTGESNIHALMANHTALPAEPVIPHLAVKKVTREHLIRLLAIACVIRDPARFNVSLPQLPSTRQLEVVDVAKPTPLNKLANQAGMPVDDLKTLNSGYRSGKTGQQSTTLLLPHDKAEQLRQNLPDLLNTSPATPTVSVNHPDSSEANNSVVSTASAPVEPALAEPKRATTVRPRSYTVTPRDTLWSIARRHATTVKQLQQWNALDSKQLKPGQQLLVSAPD